MYRQSKASKLSGRERAPSRSLNWPPPDLLELSCVEISCTEAYLLLQTISIPTAQLHRTFTYTHPLSRDIGIGIGIDYLRSRVNLLAAPDIGLWCCACVFLFRAWVLVFCVSGLDGTAVSRVKLPLPPPNSSAILFFFFSSFCSFVVLHLLYLYLLPSSPLTFESPLSLPSICPSSMPSPIC
jgi:hypothetical protein